MIFAEGLSRPCLNVWWELSFITSKDSFYTILPWITIPRNYCMFCHSPCYILPVTIYNTIYLRSFTLLFRATCVYLACKVEEFNVSIGQFVGNIKGDRNKAMDIILSNELLLMQHLNYYLTIHNPYRPVEGFLIDIKVGKYCIFVISHILLSSKLFFFFLTDSQFYDKS